MGKTYSAQKKPTAQLATETRYVTFNSRFCESGMYKLRHITTIDINYTALKTTEVFDMLVYYWAVAGHFGRRSALRVRCWICGSLIKWGHAAGGTVGWGTALQTVKVAGSIPGGVIGIFHLYNPSGPQYDPGVDSASNRNEYQEYFLGVKAAGA